MPFTLDKGTVGTFIQGAGTAASFTVATSAAVASGGLVVFAFGGFVNTNPITGWTVSGGGLTWTVRFTGTAASSDSTGLAWALAPAGMPSSTNVTFTATGTTPAISGATAVGTSWLGAKQVAPEDGNSLKAFAAIASGQWAGSTIPGMTGASDLVAVSAFGDGQPGPGSTTLASVGAGWTAGPTASQAGSIGGVSSLIYAMNVASVPAPAVWGTWATNLPTGAGVVTVAFLADSSPVVRTTRAWTTPQRGLRDPRTMATRYLRTPPALAVPVTFTDSASGAIIFGRDATADLWLRPIPPAPYARILPLRRGVRDRLSMRRYVRTPPPLAAAVTFTDAMTGAWIWAGARSEARIGTNAAAGAWIWAGGRAEAKIGANSRTGTIILGGTRSEARIGANSATGAVILAGSRTEARRATDAATGVWIWRGGGSVSPTTPAAVLTYRRVPEPRGRRRRMLR